ncbi:ACP phosphodiesterase [Aeromicrobium sp. Root495]|uniref:FMN-dependent NADH-azoreductase n=1 Tax=Aeromicrobium sp. Root495 TaxID=1736550 RepID=UPI0006F3E3B3|nr:NAD(P)H-dependent oxidoreductase [Aeromicrobium sp. Root495]KQY59781.1 ACP phosphodiesterase [Aeromicrobium sp. Root495]RYJ06939.1 MAG: flavodoxin family protein [Actinomycetales bacterium]
MTTLLRVDASIRQDGSVTRGVADTLETEIGPATTLRRDLGTAPLPSDTWPQAVAAAFSPEPDAAQLRARALATEVADELVSADAVVVATPLYNFGVPAAVKAWIDVVITDPRFAPGVPSPVAGRPAFLVVARGGGYGEGTPREGWDHATAYLKRILVDVWGLDLQVIEAELTLAPSTPGMESLIDLARENLDAAHATARDAGRALDTVGAA